MGVDRTVRLVTDLVKDRLLKCMGKFYSRSLARIGARDGMWKSGIEIDSDKELMEFGRMV